MPGGEVHHGQRVIGILDRPIELPQGHPTDAAVVVLEELAVHLGALADREYEVGPVPGRQPGNIVEVGVRTSRAGAVRAVLGSICRMPISTRICTTSRPSRARTLRAMITPGRNGH